jgi:PhzF family phenazine biosynthesis protein
MTIDTHPPPKIPFSIENAFTDRLEGGNPAAIVHLPSLPVLPDATLQAIAANFNQPIAVFITPLAHSETVAPSASGAKMARFSIRWFTPELETSLCGHGTLAAAAAVFRGKDGADAGELTEIRFEATSGKYLVARKLEEGRIEIQLDSELSEELSVEEDIELRGILAKALGANVTVRYTGRGAGDLKNYALIEVDTLELKNVKVNTNALVSTHALLCCRELSC